MSLVGGALRLLHWLWFKYHLDFDNVPLRFWGMQAGYIVRDWQIEFYLGNVRGIEINVKVFK